MNTLDVMIQAKIDKKTFFVGNMYYNEEKGFHSEGGWAWEARAFPNINAIMEINDWKEHIPTEEITISGKEYEITFEQYNKIMDIIENK